MFIKGFFESKKHYEKRMAEYKEVFDEIKQEQDEAAARCDKLIEMIQEQKNLNKFPNKMYNTIKEINT